VTHLSSANPFEKIWNLLLAISASMIASSIVTFGFSFLKSSEQGTNLFQSSN